MVFVHKTYGRVHGVLAKVTAILMIVIGFVVLLFLSLPRPVGFFGNISEQGGVAHADAVSSAPSYSEGGDDSCGCDSGSGCDAP